MDSVLDRRSAPFFTTWERIAWAAWIAVVVFFCIRTYHSPSSRTIYPVWSSTSQLWWGGGELYSPYRSTSVPEGYRYAPTFPILTTPFAVFPDAVGGVLWRIFCIATFAAAVGWWIRQVLPAPLSRDQVAQLYLLLLPLSVQSMSNGQANVPVTALLLATLAAVKQERWNWVGIFSALAFVCKLYPIAMGMVLCTLYPRKLIWRIGVAIVALMALPFLCQRPEYVLDQYSKWFELLKADDRTAIGWDQMYRDLWLLIRVLQAPISRSVYQLIQVGGGAAVALICWYRHHHGWSTRQSLCGVLALTTSWMLLLGPCGESCTYILMAPALAWSFIEVFRNPGWTWRRSLLFLSGGLFLGAVAMGAFPRAAYLHALGIHPVATLFYLAYLLTESATPAVQHATAAQPSALAA